MRLVEDLSSFEGVDEWALLRSESSAVQPPIPLKCRNFGSLVLLRLVLMVLAPYWRRGAMRAEMAGRQRLRVIRWRGWLGVKLDLRTGFRRSALAFMFHGYHYFLLDNLAFLINVHD